MSGSLFPMTKEQYAAYLKSAKWRSLREKIFKRDKYKCTDCSGKHNLHVHHLTYERVGEELLEDLKTLCRKCHEKQHKGELLIKLIELCCRKFLSQKPSEDYNPFKLPTCHGCDKVFEYEETRYAYGITAFGTAPTYCEACIKKVKALLLKSKCPEYVNDVVPLNYAEQRLAIDEDGF